MDFVLPSGAVTSVSLCGLMDPHLQWLMLKRIPVPVSIPTQQPSPDLVPTVVMDPEPTADLCHGDQSQ